MALIFLGKRECSICGKVLQQDDDIVATTAFIADPSHPLWRFSDSGMHRECFRTWEHAAAFRALYNQTRRGHSLMREDGTLETS
jgi:hypothetical protein